MQRQRTQICEFDLRSPDQVPLWQSAYRHMLVLVRHGPRPAGLVRLNRRETGAAPVARAVLEEEITRQLGAAPVDFETRCGNGSANPVSVPPISVVVCSRDRAESLDRCLKSLGRLRYPSFEVIVVDSASAEDTTRRVAEGNGLGYVRLDRPGLNRARNAGIQAARHDIVAFVDDDVIVDPGWLQGFAIALADPDIAGTTGLVLPQELETHAQHLFEAYGQGMSKGFQPQIYERRLMGPRDLIAVQAIGVGANMAFRRSLLESLGGFDPALDVGTPAAGAGDLDLFHRALMAGATIRYTPEALVWHRHRTRLRDLSRQLTYNGRSFGVYLIKLWSAGDVNGIHTLYHAFGRWVPWLAGRLLLSLIGRHPLPPRLTWAELWGALQAPSAYLRTKREMAGVASRDGPLLARQTAGERR